MAAKEHLEFVLNGKSIAVDINGARTLIDLLREDLGIHAVKRGCEEGECGGCTVIVDGRTVSACITSVSSIQGTHIETL